MVEPIWGQHPSAAFHGDERACAVGQGLDTVPSECPSVAGTLAAPSRCWSACTVQRCAVHHHDVSTMVQVGVFSRDARHHDTLSCRLLVKHDTFVTVGACHSGPRLGGWPGTEGALLIAMVTIDIEMSRENVRALLAMHGLTSDEWYGLDVESTDDGCRLYLTDETPASVGVALSEAA